jgi:hypothetical protein
VLIWFVIKAKIESITITMSDNPIRPPLTLVHSVSDAQLFEKLVAKVSPILEELPAVDAMKVLIQMRRQSKPAANSVLAMVKS